MGTANDSILPLRLDRIEYRAGGRLLLTGITATIAAGTRTVVLGANGAGKSLLLRICHGMLPSSGGRLSWGSGRQNGAPRLRQAMLFQRPVLLRRSVEANVAYALAVRGVPRGERVERVRAVLETTGLATLARRPARLLSGGEQQRLALARIWAIRPEIAFLDEPTASLDPGAARAVEGVIRDMHAAGTKIVLTTQHLGQARRLADEILFLHQGRLLETAPAARFFTNPQTDAARAFLDGELPG